MTSAGRDSWPRRSVGVEEPTGEGGDGSVPIVRAESVRGRWAGDKSAERLQIDVSIATQQRCHQGMTSQAQTTTNKNAGLASPAASGIIHITEA